MEVPCLEDGKLETVKPKPKELSREVLQGSVLGPVLFILRQITFVVPCRTRAKRKQMIQSYLANQGLTNLK